MQSETGKDLVTWFPIISGISLTVYWAGIRITRRVKQHYIDPIPRTSDMEKCVNEATKTLECRIDGLDKNMKTILDRIPE